jgi:acyl-CoA synthetase (AMP-forming)/AMP-acid ligase II
MTQTGDKSLSQFATLIEILWWRAAHQPDTVAYTFLTDGESEKEELTYGELHRGALQIAARLSALGVVHHPVLLLYPAGLEFIQGFFGALYAGAIAVPLYPPHRNRPDHRLAAVIENSGARHLMTTQDIARDMPRYRQQTPALACLECIATDKPETQSELTPSESAVVSAARDPSTLAFLQYTSGSTGVPKGVMVSHRNLIVNLELIRQSFQHTEKLRVIGWLPLFHDMGLVGNILQPLYVGGTLVFMSPVHFLQHPIRWLRAIAKHRGTTSGGPNFAYDHCVQRITPEQLIGLDLSSWEVAFNGAEPIRQDTMDRFTEAFASHGFRRNSFLPCYGMAETTLLVAAGPRPDRPAELRLSQAALAQDRVVPAAASLPIGDVHRGVGCGRASPAESIVIVDPATLSPCDSDRVGEIWVAGESIAQGYWRLPEETREKFQATLPTFSWPFLRTGDLGFLSGSELFVTGRLKDLIIIRGSNHYPQDIEQTVEAAHPAVRQGCCAAFSITVDGEERLVVTAEVDRQYLRGLDEAALRKAIQGQVFARHELRPHTVCLLRPGGVPKTSSGKIRRNACKNGFLEKALPLLGTTSATNESSMAVITAG